MNILYSIIIPAYNEEKTLPLCLKSLFRQTIETEKFEVIVVDDGSSDTTKDVALSYPVRYIFQNNQGPAVARNAGAKVAEGDWIFFIDADCEPAIDWLEEMIKSTQNGASGVQGAYLTKQTNLIPKLVQLEFDDRYLLMSNYEKIDLVATYSAGFAKDIFLANHGFDPNFPKANNEDTEFSYRLSKAGYKLVFASKAFVYHQHPSTLLAYLRTKFWRGYWRMEVYKNYPQKAIKDKYTTNNLKIQVISLLVALFALLMTIFWTQMSIFVLIFILLALFSSIPSAFRLVKSNEITGFLIPFFYFFRSLALALGIIYWIKDKVLWPRFSLFFNRSQKGQLILFSRTDIGLFGKILDKFKTKKNSQEECLEQTGDISEESLNYLYSLVDQRHNYYYLKRVLDIILSFGLLTLAFPVSLIIYFLIRIESKGPVIFKQKRIGSLGNPFYIYKFRTMFVDSPKYELSPDNDQKDPRVTACGKILRNTGLDELPQFYNILKGDMSIVGPRPEMPFLYEKYKDIMCFRNLIKPGLTGLWQLSPYRSDQIYNHLEYDFYYLKYQSLKLDLKILLKTFFITFKLIFSKKIISKFIK